MVKVEDNSSDSNETEVDFKSKLETEDETLMGIKQEKPDIKYEVPSTSTFHSGGNQDMDDSVPSINFQKPNQKHAGIEDDFKCIGSSNIKIETEDKILLNIKQEEINIKDEVPSTSTFQSGGNQDVDDNAPSVGFQERNQKFVSSHKTHREKLFVCNVCDYKSAWKANLTVHMKRHTGEKSFACGLCDYKSARKYCLTNHMKNHTGEKPFVCDLCDFKSAQKSYLTIHMRSHTGEKPFTCDLCDFKSAQKGNLTIHMRCHTGEKPFGCGLCDFKTTQKITLVRHMKRHLKL